MMSLETKNILITGSQGFIGKQLVKELLKEKKYRLHYLFHKHFKHFLNIDTCIHLAAKADDVLYNKNTKEYIKSNVDYTLKVAQTYLESGLKRFIFMSSIKVYGSSGHFKETDSTQPDSAYAVSKMIAEQKLIALFKGYPKSQLIILRIPLVYGVNNKANMAKLITYTKKRYPLPLGCATAKRSFLSIDNLILCIKELLKHSYNGIYNIADSNSISAKELSKVLSIELTGKKPRLIYIPKRMFWLISKINKPVNKMFQRLFLTFTMNTEKIKKDLANLKLLSTNQAIKNLSKKIK